MDDVPRLPIVQGVHSRAFRAIDDLLRNDPTLRRAIRTFRSWTGEPDDDTQPTLAQAPWMRLTPVPDPANLETEGDTNTALTIRIETFTAGTRVDDCMDLWTALVRVLYPGDRTVLERFNAAGIYGYRLLQPAFGIGTSGEVVGFLSAGTLSLMIFQTTQV